jgi:hypothetical protein
MDTPIGITISRNDIVKFCRRHHIRRLALFGSVLRGDFRPDSDVDVLVEFDPGARTGFRFAGMQAELGRILARDVHLLTPGFISDDFRKKALENTQVIYERA